MSHSECRIDGGSYATCVSGDSFPVLEGTHTFDVRSVDNAGNTGAASSFAWTVDTTAPVITNVSDSPGPDRRHERHLLDAGRRATVTVKVYDGTDTLVRTLVDAAPGSGGPQLANWDLKDDRAIAVPNGTYTYEIDAVDNVGNAAIQQSGTISVQVPDEPRHHERPGDDGLGERPGLITVERRGAGDDPVTVGNLTVTLRRPRHRRVP